MVGVEKNMTDEKYNFDDTFSVRNKLTGNSFVNDVQGKKIVLKEPVTGKRKNIASFCVTDLVWDNSNKDISKIRLEGSTAGSGVEYTLASNHAALKNRIFKECLPSGTPGFVPSSPDKKFMHFGVNSYLYEFISLLVYGIQNETLPLGKETVTLAITSADTAEFENGSIIVTATDESSTAIAGLDITGSIGDDIEIDGTTDSNGQVTTTVTTAGTYDVVAESEETTSYKKGTVTKSVTVTAVEAQGEETG